MKMRYELRLHRLENRAAGIHASRLDEKPLTQFQLLQEAVIRFEREVLEQLRRQETISEEALRKIENELDLEEARLALDKG
jgi:CPA1 family monovalent cation:H+ antiporter